MWSVNRNKAGHFSVSCLCTGVNINVLLILIALPMLILIAIFQVLKLHPSYFAQ